MTYEEIAKELKSKKYRPIYLLMGDEPYFIDRISNYIADHVLEEHEKGFNQMIMYGKDVTAALIDNTARRFPMMAKYQVVIVKEAQNIKGIEELVYYASKPQPSTILVLNYKYKKVAKNTKFYKAVETTGIVFESKKLYDNQVPDWIVKYMNLKGYAISDTGATLLSEHIGNDLNKITNEIDKLIISLPKGTQINTSHIEENIGISKDFNVFELNNALGSKNVLKANRIIDYFGKNPKENPINLVIINMFIFFTKVLKLQFITNKSRDNIAKVLGINPYFIKDYEIAAKKYDTRKLVYIISALREYDLKSKGVNNVSADSGELLKELIFKILH